MTHSLLVKEAIAKLQKAQEGTAASFYPKSSFFDKLSTKDLKDMLAKRSISLPEKSSDRTALVSTLRRNLRYIYLQGRNNVASLGETLQLENREFFDKAGNFKSSLFYDWSDNDLKFWLKEHELLPESSSSSTGTYKHSDLVNAARQNAQSLKDDIDTYVAYKSSHATPLLSKATQAVADTYDSVLESTFNLWSGSRIESFLQSRGVPFAKSASRQDLLKLMQRYKDNTADVIGAWSFDQWSQEDIKQWLYDQGQTADGTREQLVEEATTYLNSLHSGISSTGSVIVSAGQNVYDSVAASLTSASQAAFDSWTESDLKAYVDSYGVDNSNVLTRSDLINSAKANFQLFTTGKTSTKKSATQNAKIYGSLLYSYLVPCWEQVRSTVSTFYQHLTPSEEL